VRQAAVLEQRAGAGERVGPVESVLLEEVLDVDGIFGRGRLLSCVTA